ncbi:tRNA (N(6)-L-threonylcarbamoyladenosine(37)-C(2))-methylthiotransferase MtaB [Chloroflexota bacterium]
MKSQSETMAGEMGKEHIKVALDTLGCKLNQAETELLARQFAEAGYRLVSPDAEADVYILNTCTVTHVADRKSRHLLRLAHRRNPDALLVATGCYAERARRELSGIEGVGLVLSNEEKPHLLRLLEESGSISSHVRRDSAGCHYNGLRTRAFVKVQDGCNSFCTYCIVPLVRGREQSLPADRISSEVRSRVADDCKEVVLTGTEIGSYNYNGTDLEGLLEHILAETDVTRLRLSSLQPQEISPELVGLWCAQRLCRHFHLSLQSGSDSVLNRMKRRYSTSDYQQAVSLIREAAPEAAITTDIIVGFPGETDEEFEESYNFCRQMEFARIHVFSYSPRQGTEAARMPHQVDEKIKKQRNEKMLALARESIRNFSQRFLGRTMPVLWEKQTDGIWSGLTDNYIKVYTRSDKDLTNRLLPAKLGEVREDGVWEK